MSSHHIPTLQEWLGGFLGALEIGLVLLLFIEIARFFGKLGFSGIGGGGRSGGNEESVDRSEAAEEANVSSGFCQRRIRTPNRLKSLR